MALLRAWRFARKTSLTTGKYVQPSLTTRITSLTVLSPGLYTCIIAAGMIIVSVCWTTVYFRHKNRLQKQGKIIIENTEGFTYTL